MSLWIPSKSLLAGEHPPRGEGRRSCESHAAPEDAAVGAVAAAAGTLIPDSRAAFYTPVSAESVHDFAVRDVRGAEVALERYLGSVLLIVNVATLAPNASQFVSLESLYRKFQARGLRVLAFPSHSFGAEPRREADIEQICRNRFRATFDLFEKVAVNGKDQAPLYAFLTNRHRHPEFGGAVEHDFAKFLIDGDGQVIGRFRPAQDPLSPDVVASVERAVDAPPPVAPRP